MQKQIINPWQWQNNFGYSQAIKVTSSEGTLYCAGQAAMTAEGVPVGGSMTEQITLTCQNITEVVQQAGYELRNIVRLNIYTTSIPSFFEAYGGMMTWMQEVECKPASTLVQVEALAFPELLVEVEVTVVK